MKTWHAFLAEGPYLDVKADTLSHPDGGVYQVTGQCRVRNPVTGHWSPATLYQDVKTRDVYVRLHNDDWSKFSIVKGGK